MGDHLAILRGPFTGPLNPLIIDVSRGPPGLSGGPGPLGPHRNSTTGYGDNMSRERCVNREGILKPPSESQNSFGIKSRNREDTG